MTTRPASVADRAFIVSTWLLSYASSDTALRVTPHDVDHVTRCETCQAYHLKAEHRGHKVRYLAGQEYWKGQRALVQRLLETCNVTVIEADDGLIDAWLCREASIFHYAYVRPPKRGQGILRQLVGEMAAANVVVTHLARGIQPARWPKSWRFNEYALKGVSL